jgi:hypothetical protein
LVGENDELVAEIARRRIREKSGARRPSRSRRPRLVPLTENHRRHRGRYDESGDSRTNDSVPAPARLHYFS